MRRATALAVTILALALCVSASAEIPTTISYQAVLRDDTGAPVPDGSYDITFSLHLGPDAPLTVWSETLTADAVGGIVSVRLGELASLAGLTFTNPLYLGVAIEGEPQLVPRTLLEMVPYAAHARTAEVALTADDDWATDGDNVYHEVGSVGIGTPTPIGKLEVEAADTTTAIVAEALGTGLAGQFLGGAGVEVEGQIDVGGFKMSAGGAEGHVLTSDADGVGTWEPATGTGGDDDWTVDGPDMYATPAGNVGVGTATPAAKLEVAADTTTAFVAEALGTELAGQFLGGAGVEVENRITVGSFEMSFGGIEGYVLTSDANGLGTWEPAAAAVPDDDWTVSGSDMYATPSGNVGVGTSTPAARLEVAADTTTAFAAEALGTELAGQFRGGAGVEVENVISVGGFEMNFGSVEGYVLTSDPDGFGTWEPAATAVPDEDWTVSDSDMYATPAGNVGVGTSTPAARLEVVADTTTAFVAEALGTELAGQFRGGAGVEVQGQAEVGGFKMSIGAAESYVLTSDVDGVGTWEPAAGVGVDEDWTVSGPDMHATPVGNVGIGTSTPLAKLEVAATDTATALVAAAQGTGLAAQFLGIAGVQVEGQAEIGGLKMSSGAVEGYVMTSDPDGVGTWAPAEVGGTDDDWTVSGSDMYSTPAGNVGIGTSTPLAKLQVETADVSEALHVNQTGTGARAVKITRETTPAATDDMLQVFVPSDAPDDFQFIECERDSSVEFQVQGNGQVIAQGGAVFNDDVEVQGRVIGTNFGDRVAEFTTDFASNSSHVVHAECTDTNASADAVAVYGRAELDGNSGIGGYFEGGYRGVACYSQGIGSSPHFGLYTRASGSTLYNYGIYAYADGLSSYAGYFNGDTHVVGTLSASTKAFRIDHPLDPANKYLVHSCVESDEMANVYSGNVTLDAAGKARVELPEWFEALNGDFRYQLTCVGGFAPVYIAEKIQGNSFVIAGGDPGMEISWQVTGVRQDPYASEHRIAVEQDKPAHEAGKYVHPELYGQPREASVDYHEDR